MHIRHWQIASSKTAHMTTLCAQTLYYFMYYERLLMSSDVLMCFLRLFFYTTLVYEVSVTISLSVCFMCCGNVYEVYALRDKFEPTRDMEVT